MSASKESEGENQQTEETVLKRLLSISPQPKPKKDASASPKKRGRPKKKIKE
jgi:hypothetical protein